MKKRIALVTGGYSSEAEISYKSAITVENNIDKELFDIYKIDISPDGWSYVDNEDNKTSVDRNDFSINLNNNKITFDAVLMCIHGNPGEDGKLQGYFDTLKIPYTSCDAATSAITFNKRYTVAVAKMAGISVSESMHLFRHSPVPVSTISSKLNLPVFVKPNNGGSSIGMSRVDRAEELEAAI